MKASKQLLPAIAAVMLTICLSGLINRKLDATKAPGYMDPVARHNMLVVGEKVMYLSHFPMFQEKGGDLMPHRYQVILEVSMEKNGTSIQNQYAADRQKNPAKMYSLRPALFVLPTLVAANPKQAMHSFNGTLFRGHLEKLGNNEGPLFKDAVVTVKKVVHFREFDPNAARPQQLQYLLFGKGQELFLAHWITAPPDFDQVLSIKITGLSFTDEELSKGVMVVFPNTSNTAVQRLKANQQIGGEIKTGTPAVTKKVQFTLMKELFFEEGELNMPPDFDTTPEEKKAGFR